MKILFYICLLLIIFHQINYAQKIDGNFTYDLLVKDTINIPSGYFVNGGNYSLFGNSAFIDFSIPKYSFLNSNIVAPDGTSFIVFKNTNISPGTYRLIINSNEAMSGIYMIKMNFITDNSKYANSIISNSTMSFIGCVKFIILN